MRSGQERAPQSGNKNDRIDAHKLADWLRAGLLSPVYHGESGVRLLKELARICRAVTKDSSKHHRLDPQQTPSIPISARPK